MHIRSRSKLTWIYAAAVMALALSTAGPGPGFAQQRLGNFTLMSSLSHARHLGRLAADRNLRLAVSLKLKDPVAAQNFIHRLYDPADPAYKQFLTPDQFADQFAPSQAEFDQVVQYLTSRGLNVVKKHRNRLMISVEGPVSVVENAFQLEMHEYQMEDGSHVYTANNSPMVPSGVASLLNGIHGLHNGIHWRHYLHRNTANTTPPGSGQDGGMVSSDIITAYNLSAAETEGNKGSGQGIALFELDDYSPADISAYASALNLGTPNLVNKNTITEDYTQAGSADDPTSVSYAGGSGTQTFTITAASGSGEVTLDIELALALAPAATIYVYGGNLGSATITDADYLSIFSQIANDNLAKQVSTSWGGPEDREGPGIPLATEDTEFFNAENTIFTQMVGEGISVFAASGDSGAYADTIPVDSGCPTATGTSISVQDPSSQPYVVGVGGTTLTLESGSIWGTETSWGDVSGVSNSQCSTDGGGGGISAFWHIDQEENSYQANLNTTGNKGSSVMRMVPDVSLNANPYNGYAVYLGGSWDNVFGGTSAAAPLWAAFSALVNAKRASVSLSPVGFLNLTIYPLAEGGTCPNCFHDITDGSTNRYYPAVLGYDLSTGWGTLNGSGTGSNGLFNVLTAPPAAALTASPYYASIQLGWGAVSGATSYSIYRSTSSTGSFTAIATGLTSPAYMDAGYENSGSGLSNSTTYYYYVVTALSTGGTSTSSTVSAQPNVNGAPQVPTTFRASITVN